MIYVDPSVAPPRLDRISVLRILGASRSPSAAVADLERMNPYYQKLRERLDAHIALITIARKLARRCYHTLREVGEVAFEAAA